MESHVWDTCAPMKVAATVARPFFAFLMSCSHYIFLNLFWFLFFRSFFTSFLCPHLLIYFISLLKFTTKSTDFTSSLLSLSILFSPIQLYCFLRCIKLHKKKNHHYSSLFSTFETHYRSI